MKRSEFSVIKRKIVLIADSKINRQRVWVYNVRISERDTIHLYIHTVYRHRPIFTLYATEQMILIA